MILRDALALVLTGPGDWRSNGILGQKALLANLIQDLPAGTRLPQLSSGAVAMLSIALLAAYMPAPPRRNR